MEFQKFNSLENHYREKFINLCRTSDANLKSFVATEKIHGANFSFWVDEKEIRVGKRTSFTDSSFYGCGEVISKYEKACRDLFDFINGRYLEIKSLVVYGELFGQGIQKEIPYGEKDFIAFDLVLTFHDGTKAVVDKDTAFLLLHDSGFRVVPVLMTGSMDELLAIDVENLKSKIAPDYIAEGIVIEPISVAQLSTGSRLMIKKKSLAFSENKSTKTKKPVEPLSELAEKLYSVASGYITSNRLSNVISHEGLQPRKNFGQVIGWLMKDAFDDLMRDHPDEFNDLDKAELKRVKKMLTSNCAELIKQNWDNVFDN